MTERSILDRPIELIDAKEYNRRNPSIDNYIYRSIDPTLVIVGQVNLIPSFQQHRKKVIDK